MSPPIAATGGHSTRSASSVLDPELAARVAALRFRTRRVVDGLLGGAHRSPHRGASVVFVEHRDYRPGDDFRLIDWRALARTDKHVIKRFEQETQLSAQLLLDQSASMNFRSEDHLPTKIDYAVGLLAAMGYILMGQGDAIGVVTIDAKADQFLPARSHPAHLESAFSVLAGAASKSAAEATDLKASLMSVAERLKRRGVILLASDLLDLRSDALSPLAHLRSRGHEVIVFHVLDPMELQLNTRGVARVEGLEGEVPLEADFSAVRDAYHRELDAFLQDCERQCTAAGARYILAPTNRPPEQILAGAIRSSRVRRRK